MLFFYSVVRAVGWRLSDWAEAKLDRGNPALDLPKLAKMAGPAKLPRQTVPVPAGAPGRLAGGKPAALAAASASGRPGQPTSLFFRVRQPDVNWVL
jgi:hypothetical protein